MSYTETQTYREMSPTDRRLYRDGLAEPHGVTVEAHLITRDHKFLEDLTEHLIDGQTNLQDAPVARTASASFSDPGRDINDGDGFRRHHMIQAWSLINVRTLPYTVKVPVFCGPLAGKADEGDTVSVTAEDKAFLSLTDVPSNTWRAKARAVDVIREILESTGETRFAFPRGIDTRVDEEVEIGADQEIWPWPVADEVAESAGLQLFYDAEGWARLRELPSEPSMVYRSHVPEATVTEPMAASEDWTEQPNRVLLRGGDGLIVVAALPAAHADSPDNLGRGGVPWRVTEIVENDKLKKTTAGKDWAEEHLRRVTRDYAEVSFTGIAARHSEPYDVQRVESRNRGYDFVLREASIPWLGDTMSVGFHKRVSRTPDRIRLASRRRKPPKKSKKGRDQ